MLYGSPPSTQWLPNTNFTVDAKGLSLYVSFLAADCVPYTLSPSLQSRHLHICSCVADSSTALCICPTSYCILPSVQLGCCYAKAVALHYHSTGLLALVYLFPCYKWYDSCPTCCQRLLERLKQRLDNTDMLFENICCTCTGISLLFP